RWGNLKQKQSKDAWKSQGRKLLLNSQAPRMAKQVFRRPSCERLNRCCFVRGLAARVRNWSQARQVDLCHESSIRFVVQEAFRPAAAPSCPYLFGGPIGQSLRSPYVD